MTAVIDASALPAQAIPVPPKADASDIRFVTLDLMRGGAALVVAIAHFIGVMPAHLAVDFFLVLSGFILAHRYLYGRPVGFRSFLAARIARLYPLHLLTLLLFAFVYLVRFRSLPDYADGTGWTFVANLLLLQNVGLTGSELTWNAPSWSISVEFWINVMFFACITRRTPRWLLLAVSAGALAVLATFERSLAVSLPNYFGFLNAGMLRGLCSFLLGVVAFRIHAQRAGAAGVINPVPEVVRFLVLVLSTALIIVPRPGLERLDFIAPLVFSACVVLYAVDSQRWRAVVLPLSHLGTISYSIYLLHYPILYGIRYLKELAVGLRAEGVWVDLVFDPVGSFMFYLALVLGLSHLCFKWFERPSRSLVRRWLDRPRPQVFPIG